MNVAFDPWIPVVTLDGKPKLESLLGVFTEGHLLADLSVRPHERISLMRLFLCVAHAALNGPKDYDEWREVPPRLPDAAKEYLGQWRDSFELFHPTKPWLQVPDLAPAKANDDKSFIAASKLDFAMASGSNATLFDHLGSLKERCLSVHQLVLGLLSIQNFSTCGLLGRPIWRGKATADSAVDAPCIPSSMYHTLIIAETVASSVCVNICDYDELSLLWGPNWAAEKIGRPVWESMPTAANDSTSCETYLGRLVPLSRAIRLQAVGIRMLYGEGLRYPVFPNFPREFTAAEGATTGKAKQERYLVGAKLNIRPWRQLDAILQYQAQHNKTSGPLPLCHLKNENLDIWVGALIRNPGKQDILDSQESRFHLSAKLRTEAGCKSYTECVSLASQVERRLGDAIWKYRTTLDPMNETGVGSTGTDQYWTAVEKNLGILMVHIEALGTDQAVPTREAWRSMLWKAACEAYQTVCGQETPRQIKAFTEGWKKLTAKPKEPETKPKRKGAKG
jgi:CRISPR system Cascade subunit CasA